MQRFTRDPRDGDDRQLLGAGLSRRAFVRAGARLAAAWPLAALAAAAHTLPGCGGGDDEMGGVGAPEREPATREPGGAAGEPRTGAQGAGTPAESPPQTTPSPGAQGAQGGAGTQAGGGEQAEGDLQLVTEYPANQPVLQALQYTHESSKPDQTCGNCRFYVKQSEDRGTCQVIPKGLVMQGGWCTSWQAAPA